MVTETPSAGADIRRFAYRGKTWQVVVEGNGHGWPDSSGSRPVARNPGLVTEDIDASTPILKFLAQQVS